MDSPDDSSLSSGDETSSISSTSESSSSREEEIAIPSELEASSKPNSNVGNVISPEKKANNDDNNNSVKLPNENHKPKSRLSSSGNSNSQGIHLEWKNIHFSIKNSNNQLVQALKQSKYKTSSSEKLILKDISGDVKPGEMLAILGPSGAGKSTLLDIISGRLQPTSFFSSTQQHLTGSILVNGKKAKSSDFRNRIGYVKQEDLFIPTSTVRESLRFSARLRLPSTISNEEKEQLIEETIQELELGKVGDSVIGGEMIRGISGGEKKRTAIGMELVKHSQLLCLDEPTTGLDSATALSVMKTLKKLTLRGDRSVICTLHQPRWSILKMFDKLMLLSQGEIIYYGPTLQCQSYFEQQGYSIPRYMNPADFFLDKIRVKLSSSQETQDEQDHSVTQDQLNKLKRAYSTSLYRIEDIRSASKQAEEERQRVEEREAKDKDKVEEAKEEPVELLEVYDKHNKFNSSWTIQFWENLKRSSKRALFDPLIFATEYPTYLLNVIIIWMLYWSVGYTQLDVLDRVAAIFIVLLTCMLSPALAVVLYFPEERILFNRERASGYYRVSAYYIATAFATVPIQLFGALSLVLLVYWTTGFKTNAESFFIMYGMSTLLALAGDAFGMTVGCAIPNTSIANLVATMGLLVWLNFCGFFVNKQTMPKFFLYVFHYTGFFKYGLEAVIYDQFKGLKFECDKTGGVCPIPADTPVTINNTSTTFGSLDITCETPCQFSTGEDILQFFNFEGTNVLSNALITIGFWFGIRLIGYLCLRFLKIGRS